MPVDSRLDKGMHLLCDWQALLGVHTHSVGNPGANLRQHVTEVITLEGQDKYVPLTRVLVSEHANGIAQSITTSKVKSINAVTLIKCWDLLSHAGFRRTVNDVLHVHHNSWDNKLISRVAVSAVFQCSHTKHVPLKNRDVALLYCYCFCCCYSPLPIAS